MEAIVETPTEDRSKRRRKRNMNPLRMLALALALAAVIKELRLPKEQRTWHGMLAGFIPYDFRKPSIDRVKSTMWNPEGPIIVGRVFGVGWTLNIGALVGRLRGHAATS